MQNNTATLEIEVGGRDNSNPQSPQFDVLDVSGNLAIDGQFDVSLIDGFFPRATDTFLVTDANQLLGNFSNIACGDRIDLSSGIGSFQVNYGSTSQYGDNQVVLSDFEAPGDFDGNGIFECADVDGLVAVIAAGSNIVDFDMNGDGLVNATDLNDWLAIAGAVNLPSGNAYLAGDGNLDGNVDGSDFGIWNANKFTTTAAWCSGDYNADGAVDGSDFGIWNANKFTSAAAVAAVPEPYSVTLSLLGAILLAVSTRRRS